MQNRTKYLSVKGMVQRLILKFYSTIKRFYLKYGSILKIFLAALIITIPLTICYTGIVKGTRKVEINQLYKTALALRVQELQSSMNVLTEQINVYRGVISTELWNELVSIKRVITEKLEGDDLPGTPSLMQLIKGLSYEYPKYEFSIWNRENEQLEVAYAQGKPIDVDEALMDYLMEPWPSDYYRDEVNQKLIFFKVREEVKLDLMGNVTLNLGEELKGLDAHMSLVQLNLGGVKTIEDYFGDVLFSTHPFNRVIDYQRIGDRETKLLTAIKKSFDHNRDYYGFYREETENQDYLIFGHKSSDFSIGILLTIPTSTFTTGVLDMIESYDQGRQERVIGALAISAITILAAFIGGALVIRKVKMKEVMMEKRRAHLVLEHNEIIFSKYERINEMAHDVKNHISSIKGLIELEQNQAALDYIDVMYDDLGKLSNTIVTGNQLMDVILNEKLNVIKKSDIQFDYKIERVNLSFISDKDLTILLTNLLDNAIESCHQSQNKEIEFQVYTFNESYVIIKLTNSCDHAPLVVNQLLMSRKRERMTYGYGVKNIERVTTYYNGMTRWKFDELNAQFQFTVTIPIPTAD
ncbi:MAG: GHKL domain-containing protein [Lactobacillus sp.]|nr:GHKL domain-containing protein [Lactobacillus sp.]